MKDAMTLYNEVNNNRAVLSGGEIAEVCEEIRKADGDRAWIIYKAKTDGWWTSDVETTCNEIRNAPGNRAMAIYRARYDGWWDSDVTITCEEIRNAPGNRVMAIYFAMTDGWWDSAIATTCNEIRTAPGDSDLAISGAKQDGWWVGAETCTIAEDVPNLALDTSNFNSFIAPGLNEQDQMVMNWLMRNGGVRGITFRVSDVTDQTKIPPETVEMILQKLYESDYIVKTSVGNTGDAHQLHDQAVDDQNRSYFAIVAYTYLNLPSSIKPTAPDRHSGTYVSQTEFKVVGNFIYNLRKTDHRDNATISMVNDVTIAINNHHSDLIGDELAKFVNHLGKCANEYFGK